MFGHVQACSACLACFNLVQSMFKVLEHAKHEIDCKNGNNFPFMFSHVQACSACLACFNLVQSMFKACSHMFKMF